jgi:GNAT superfamily N-acetyltransferase
VTEPSPPAGPGGGPHPLLPVLLDAAAGVFPPVDGRVEFLPGLPGGQRCVVSFTGHAYVATPQPPAAFADLELDGFGQAVHPAALLRLAGADPLVIGVLDCTLAGRGRGGAPESGASRGGSLPRRADLDDHPRVRHARSLRHDVRVFGDERGLVTLAHGLAGRLELSIEVPERLQGKGVGGSLLAEALALVPTDEPVFAGVSPGNVRSLRAFLRAGFEPIGGEVILAPRG